MSGVCKGRLERREKRREAAAGHLRVRCSPERSGLPVISGNDRWRRHSCWVYQPLLFCPIVPNCQYNWTLLGSPCHRKDYPCRACLLCSSHFWSPESSHPTSCDTNPSLCLLHFWSCSLSDSFPASELLLSLLVLQTRSRPFHRDGLP